MQAAIQISVKSRTCPFFSQSEVNHMTVVVGCFLSAFRLKRFLTASLSIVSCLLAALTVCVVSVLSEKIMRKPKYHRVAKIPTGRAKYTILYIIPQLICIFDLFDENLTFLPNNRHIIHAESRDYRPKK